MATKVITPELVKEHIKRIPELSDEDVVHFYKCASSSQERLIKPYEQALAKECKKRASTQIKTQSLDEVAVEEEEAKKNSENLEKEQEEY